MNIPFTKMNGAGNDFVMLDNRDASLQLASDTIARLCDRHRGIGADGLLLVEPPKPGSSADFTFRYFNADGGEAEMCGNGARCFARFAKPFLPADAASLSFDTIAGPVQARFEGDLVTIQLSPPIDHRPATPLEINGRTLDVHSINTGVPHAIVFVDDLEQTDVVADGRALRHHHAFAPTGTNVNFVAVTAPGHIIVRTYERGVEGETLACGTGVTACALIHQAIHHAPSPVEVIVRSGDTLRIGFSPQPDGSFTQVSLTGPAETTFHGQIAI